MKRIAFVSWLLCNWTFLFAQKDSFYLLTPVEVKAVRAGEMAPFAKTNLSRRELAKVNLGQDIPFLLDQTPSVVVNADAGNGIGYTGLRIRGTDATRINVTLNGIPYNDAESQGTFFVDLPDFSSSVGSIQIQRGVGTSSNGAGAFGASINFSTNEVNRESYAEFSNSAGSFNTWKNTIRAGTGLINDHFTADLRLSRVSSDGYIDRATSRLGSYYFSAAYLAAKSSLRFNIFSGHEKTYQAWYGISQADLDQGNRRVNYAGTEKPGDPYDNETDNYWQDQYQLFFDHRINPRLTATVAFFLVNGKGYYEQYKADQPYSQYGLNQAGNADFVRQLWLNNHFYGGIYSLQYKTEQTEITAGGGYHRYEGNHYGELIWASAGLGQPRWRWYDLDALKSDFSLYVKQQTRFATHWFYFYDLQYRLADYAINGFRNNPGLKIDNRYHFFNPRAGLSYQQGAWKAFASYSLASKEPNRDDFEAGKNQQPRPEKLKDLEIGVENGGHHSSWSATLYYMQYRDQLVLTGKINDVGAYTRTNIPRSYRLGLELQGSQRVGSQLRLTGNLTLSQNKVMDFSEYIDDYDLGGQQRKTYRKTDLAYSPDLVGAATFSYLPVSQLELSLVNKYVSRQLLDNTGNDDRSLRPYLTQDVRASYTLHASWMKEMTITARINNLFNVRYEPNGYTYSYISGGQTQTENYYFPMAGTNLLVGVSVRF